jgi:hypothetical protein
MTSPTPLKKKLSRLWVFEVNTGSEESPTWTRVNGLTSATLTITPNEVDVTDNDSEGWQDNLTTCRAWALALAGWDGYTGPDNAPVDDPGQAFLKAKGLLTGSEAYADIQFYRSDTEKGYTGRVNVNYGGAGGDTKAAEPLSCNLTGSGACTPLDLAA